MASAEIGVTRTVVFRRKPEGKEVDEEKWKGVVRAVRATAGVEGQAWGSQVENEEFFVWSIDFESLEKREDLLSSSIFENVEEHSGRLFQEKRNDLTTAWTSEQQEVAAALRAGITEVAFFKVSSTTLTIVEAKRAVENALVTILEAVKKYGNARGAAIGWVVNGNADEAVLHGVFGYDSLKDHLNWREHPEHGKASHAFVDLAARGISVIPDVRVEGVDAAKGYFHVKYES